jgi:hypothetical protein
LIAEYSAIKYLIRVDRHPPLDIGATAQSELSFAFRLTTVVQLDNLIPFKSCQGKLLGVRDEIIQALEAIALT